MEIRKGFYDLCVPYNKNASEMSRILAELYEYGYRTVAIEQEFDHTTAGKKSSDHIPKAIDLSQLKQEFQGKLTLLNRLTIIYQEPIIVHAMNTSLNLKQYHLVAGAPKTEAALQHCCSTFNGDIVTRHATESGGYKMIHVSHKYYQLALRRGLCFEIKYGPAIVDSNLRKDMLTIGHSYATQRKAKNVIISSGATNRFHVRGPYDIANLGLIFGLSEEQSKSAISHVCRRVLLKSEARRYGKTVMYVTNIKRTANHKKKGVSVYNEEDTEEDDDDDEDDVDDDEDDFDGYSEQPIKKLKIAT